jgi:hypothetical protein
MTSNVGSMIVLFLIGASMGLLLMKVRRPVRVQRMAPGGRVVQHFTRLSFPTEPVAQAAQNEVD